LQFVILAVRQTAQVALILLEHAVEVGRQQGGLRRLQACLLEASVVDVDAVLQIGLLESRLRAGIGRGEQVRVQHLNLQHVPARLRRQMFPGGDEIAGLHAVGPRLKRLFRRAATATCESAGDCAGDQHRKMGPFRHRKIPLCEIRRTQRIGVDNLRT
jgi:hypothetical protein